MQARLTNTQFLNLLAQHITNIGGVQVFARKHKISASFVSQVLHGQRPPPEWVCRLLGYKKVTTRTVSTVYERIAGRS